jgi:cellulase (glycosyl hydrolase family 5)
VHKRRYARVLLVVAGLLVCGVAQAIARTAVRRPDVSHGPGLTVGFSLAPELATGNAAGSAGYWDAKAHAIGTQMIRVAVNWDQIAPASRPSGFSASNPNSPGYNWASVDQQVQQLTAEGFQVMLTIDGAPRWAEGPGKPSWAPAGTWEPSAADFGAFATAIARRFDGQTPGLPRVTLWQPWNEPNLDVYLSPQWDQNSHGGFVEAAPAIYRKMLNAFYSSVKAVSSANYVITAGTAPYGLPPGGARMGPVTFDQYLFCLNTNDKKVGCNDPAHFNAIDHHPYGVEGPTWHAINSYDVAVPDIYKLTRVLKVAERDHTVLPAGGKSVWVTEVSWNTNPPERGGVSVTQAAHWLEQTLYVLWSQGVSHVCWYQLADGGPGNYNSGVYFEGGRAKPGTTAFRFPFLTNRRNSSTVVAWGRSPAAGQLRIQRHTSHGWTVLAQFAVSQGEVFHLPLAVHGAAQLRAELGRSTSLTWSQRS